MAGTAAYEKVPDDSSVVTLTQHVKRDITDEAYISGIPKYNGDVIPTTLKKVRMASSFESNYQALKPFLENLGKYDSSNKWVVAGLLSGSDMLVEGSKYGIFAIFFGAAKAVQSSLNVNITKQILCKRYGNKVVFLINVVDSKKTGLNTLFSNTIMIMTPHPSSSTPTGAHPPVAVHADGFVSHHLPVYYYLVGDNNELTLTQDIKGGIDSITTSLSKRDNIFVIDPNKVEVEVDGDVTVNWFGDKSLNAINDLIQRSGILGDSHPPSRTSIGGKSRYSKKRVTKRRKTTKRRHRRTTRKPT
jgi:hypothetical protein